MQTKPSTCAFGKCYKWAGQSPKSGYLRATCSGSLHHLQNASKTETSVDWKRRMVHSIVTYVVLGWGLLLWPMPALAQNAQCTLLIGSHVGQVIPVTINPAPPLNAPCEADGAKGYISRTSAEVANVNAECTIVASGHTLTVQYEGNPVPALNAACRVGDVDGYISRTSARTNITAQCTPLGGPHRGQAIAYSATPPPALKAPCKIGNDAGYISQTSASGAANAGVNADCRPLTGSHFGKDIPVTVNPAPPLNAPCQVGGDKGYISQTSSGVGVHQNARCAIVASGHTLYVPYEGNPAPALNAACQIGDVIGYIDWTSAPTHVSAQCTPLSGPHKGQGIPYSATPPPPLKASCKIGNDAGYISQTSASTQEAPQATQSAGGYRMTDWSGWGRGGGVEYRYRLGWDPANNGPGRTVDAIYQLRNSTTNPWSGMVTSANCATGNLSNSSGVMHLAPGQQTEVRIQAPNCGNATNPSIRSGVGRSGGL